MKRETVALRRCAPSSSEETVMEETEATLDTLGDLSALFKDKRKIAIKTNAGIEAFKLTEGRFTELTDPPVLEAVIRFIRRYTEAEIVVGDAPTTHEGWKVFEGLGLPQRLSQYRNVRILDFGEGPFQTATIAEPLMFKSYQLHPDIVEADAIVSVAKMKAHRSMGCTLCIKNLFGWTPPAVYGYPRHYFHDRNIRLPRVLSDLALLLKPCLNVVDGIVAANHGEWGGTPMTPGVVVAGTNIVATDATAARVMGFDPEADFPQHPFLYRNNSIKLAAEAGLGPHRADEIEVLGPQPEEVALPFEVKSYGGGLHDRLKELQEGALAVRDYRERRNEFLSKHAGRIIALRDGELLFDAADMTEYHDILHRTRRDYKTSPHFMVKVLPEEEEIERLDAYEPYENLPEDTALRKAA